MHNRKNSPLIDAHRSRRSLKHRASTTTAVQFLVYLAAGCGDDTEDDDTPVAHATSESSPQGKCEMTVSAICNRSAECARQIEGYFDDPEDERANVEQCEQELAADCSLTVSVEATFDACLSQLSRASCKFSLDGEQDPEPGIDPPAICKGVLIKNPSEEADDESDSTSRPPTKGGGKPDAGVDTETEVPESRAPHRAAFARSTRGYPMPYLLYDNGYATFDVSHLTDPEFDLALDMSEYPDNWLQWREGTDRIELKREDGWKPIHYDYECLPQERGTKLVGTFTFSDALIVANEYTRYRFYSDGTYRSCVSTHYENRSVEVEHEGTYSIAGYLISLSYTGEIRDYELGYIRWTTDNDSGTTTIPFFYDETRPKRLWLKSLYYTEPDDSTNELCYRY